MHSAFAAELTKVGGLRDWIAALRRRGPKPVARVLDAPLEAIQERALQSGKAARGGLPAARALRVPKLVPSAGLIGDVPKGSPGARYLDDLLKQRGFVDLPTGVRVQGLKKLGAFADELAKVGAAPARSILTPQSSNVRGFRYDPATQDLFITYKSGGTYRYSGVPASAARSLGRAKSVGRAVNKHIKAGRYDYEKVGMPASSIARAVRRALEKDPARVAKFIKRTGANPGARMQFGKNVAVQEARQYLSGTRQFAAKRTGNVQAPIAGEFQARFGAGDGAKLAAVPWRTWGKQMIQDALDRILGRDRREPQQQHRKQAGVPVEAASILATMRSMRKLAGVAKKQITWEGLRIKIEHEPGDIRSGTSKEGKTWERTMFDSYGYVPGTKGKAADGDAIDVYFAKEPVSGPVFKIKQLKKDTGEYDEDKFMVGFGSADAAKRAYLRHMPEWAYGDMDEIGFDDFKAFVEN